MEHIHTWFDFIGISGIQHLEGKELKQGEIDEVDEIKGGRVCVQFEPHSSFGSYDRGWSERRVRVTLSYGGIDSTVQDKLTVVASRAYLRSARV